MMRPSDRERKDSAIHRLSKLSDHDRLLTPREAAEMFGVRTTTIALWAREGRLSFVSTPGGHRRYCLREILALLNGAQPVKEDADRQTAEDAVRLYEQGWSIKQVAEKFDMGYSTMRRLLQRNGVKFRRSGRSRPDF